MKKRNFLIICVLHFLCSLLIYYTISNNTWDAVGVADPNDFRRATCGFAESMIGFFPFNALFTGLFLSVLFSFPFGLNYIVIAILSLLNLLASFLTIYLYDYLNKNHIHFKKFKIILIILFSLNIIISLWDYFRF